MTDQEIAYNEVQRLVTEFKNTPASKRKSMNEMQTRLGYILPLFRALGWDINNINEVTPEEKVSRGWVDFSFRLGNIPRFFLETKRAEEDLNNPAFVKQAIDYAWTKSVTWALLSDFEGLRVFNAEWKESDPFRAQFFEFDLDGYLSDFSRLWWLSKPETSARRLDIEAEKVGKKIKRLPVSQNLFDDLKTWRENLFNSYKKWNPIYSIAQVDEAVLRLLNRLIFIRTAEDREVENIRLRSLVRELKDRKQIQNLDRELSALFRELDGVYNSELFAKHFSEELKIAPTDLEEVIEGLYEKNYTRYNFNALEADVLGTAYEQYLGHVVTEEEGEAHVETKRTKRKSQGIYYTPAFVTKYIVQQTVGKYLQENGYNPSKPPRVLDMACGSGSFLIEAFDVIDKYVMNMRNQQNSEVSETSEFLARARQMEILQNCIYGVDKDKQAVEVARLNLLLRGLHSREKLPMLENIANADSLQNDTYPFHFPKVIQEGGFDVIIGNPPYVRQETLGEEFKTYAKEHFETFAGTADLYIYFIEQAHKLLKPNGYFGMIVSNKWMRSNYGKPLRQFLKDTMEILEIIDFGELPVFSNVATFPSILIGKKRPTNKQNFVYTSVKNLDFTLLDEATSVSGIRLTETSLGMDAWTLTDNKSQTLMEKLEDNSRKLGEYVEQRIYRGVVTGCNEVFIIDKSLQEKLIRQDEKSKEIIKPFVFGDEVRRYKINYQERYLIFTRRGINIKQYPAIYKYLLQHKERLTPKPKAWQGEWNGRKEGTYKWYEIQDSTDYYSEFEKPKIVYGQFQIAPHFAYSHESLLFGSNHYMLLHEDANTLFFLCGILNSKLYFWYMGRIAGVLGDAEKRGRLVSQKSHIVKFPIRNATSLSEKKLHDEIVSLVEKMLALQKERQAVRPEDDLDHARNLDRQITNVDSEIDKRVYVLYGLTEEEIKIVEGK